MIVVRTQTRSRWLRRQGQHLACLRVKGLGNLKTLDHYLWGTFGRAAESIISGVVTGVWTAFEAMSGDLWEAALNASPNVLAKLPGEKARGEKDLGKQISVDRLAQHGFDLRGKMGTLLRERFEFSSLDKIRIAYAAAFPAKHEIPILLCDEKALFRLSMVRNLIVHRAGVVDEEFAGKMRNDPELSKVAKGETLKLTGTLARELVDPVIECGTQLIRKVDEFLVAHP